MKKYEGMFIIKSDLSKENFDKTIGQINDAIVKNGGSVSAAKELGKQHLSFPIKKYKEGIYYLVNFDIDTDAISKIKRAVSLNESILRALIVK